MRSFRSHAKSIIDEHWTRERISLVVIGQVSFYVTYVSYRNLKNFLPLVYGKQTHDTLLHHIDRFLFFGNEPAVVLHCDVLGSPRETVVVRRADLQRAEPAVARERAVEISGTGGRRGGEAQSAQKSPGSGGGAHPPELPLSATRNDRVGAAKRLTLPVWPTSRCA